MIPDLGVQAWGDLKGYNYAIIMGENLPTQHQLNSRPKEIHQLGPVGELLPSALGSLCRPSISSSAGPP